MGNMSAPPPFAWTHMLRPAAPDSLVAFPIASVWAPRKANAIVSELRDASDGVLSFKERTIGRVTIPAAGPCAGIAACESRSQGRDEDLRRRRTNPRRGVVFSFGCIRRIEPTSQEALSRTVGKPGIGFSRVLLTASLVLTCRTSKPRGAMTVICPMCTWAMISTSQSSNSASVRSIITEPTPVLILVRRPTCQRPSRRTSPIEVESSSGS